MSTDWHETLESARSASLTEKRTLMVDFWDPG